MTRMKVKDRYYIGAPASETFAFKNATHFGDPYSFLNSCRDLLFAFFCGFRAHNTRSSSGLFQRRFGGKQLVHTEPLH